MEERVTIDIAYREQLSWFVNAGLRFLSYFTPEHAEAEWYGTETERNIIEERIATGSRSATSSYNVIWHEPWGNTRFITHFSSGAGRNWQGGFPDEVKAFETIEVDLCKAPSGSPLSNGVIAAARSLSKKAGAATENKISKLHLPAGARLSDLSVFHTGLQPAFLSSHEAGLGNSLIEFLEYALVALSDNKIDVSTIDQYERDLFARYRNNEEPGLKVVSLLLLLEIWRAALPEWPFVKWTWVCGALDCQHALCRMQRDKIYKRADSLIAILGAMIIRDVYAYTLKNTISLPRLLESIASHDSGLAWLEKAAASLLERAEGLRKSLSSTKPPEEFYCIHHDILAVCPAALIGYGFLRQRGAKERAAEFGRLEHASEEIKARSIAALSVDLQNSLNLEHLLWYRLQLERERQRSEVDCSLLMQKWLYDETILPNCWEPFLSGVTNELRIVSAFPGAGEPIYNSMLIAFDRARGKSKRSGPIVSL